MKPQNVFNLCKNYSSIVGFLIGGFEVRAIRLIFPLLIICLAPQLAKAISHQLIDKHYLDVGNRWEYQIHITEDPDAGSVDWWGTAIDKIVKNETIEGYETVLCETTGEIPSVETWWVKSNCYLTSEYLVEVRVEDEDMINLVRNNDPFERAPVWVGESDNNRHFGHGEHYGILKDPYYTWDGYQDNYITFLRTESITVPAGSFDCVVVFIRSEFHEFEGLWGYVEMTFWADPEVGVVKSDEYAWMWDPIEEQAYTGRGTTELTSVSLVHPPEPEPARGDLDGDGFINFADFAFLSHNWNRNDCNMSNQWCNEADLYFSGNVDELDLAVFCDNWLNNLSLAAHWTMDDNEPNTTVVDSSLYGNHGTAQQYTSVMHTTGVIDGALTFNGSSDYINCQSPSLLDQLEAFSYSLWIKRDQTDAISMLLHKNHKQLYLTQSGQLLVFSRSDGTNPKSLSTDTVSDTSWHHIVATYDDNGDRKFRIYLDGSEVAYDTQVTGTGILNDDSAASLYISYSSYGFDGLIDQVKIFDRALTAGEIQQLYQQGLE